MMMKTGLLSILLLEYSTAFQPAALRSCACLPRQLHPPLQQAAAADDDGGSTNKKGDNKAMAFLRSKGRIGGAANMDFANAMGLDESPSGGTQKNATGGTRKAKAAYVSCVSSGVIDDMSDPFPFTSSGSQWQGITDRVMGGTSNGSLSRETIEGKLANVLRGHVSLENNGGFIQMATDLSLDPSEDVFVNADQFDGVELEVYCEGTEVAEKFNVHLRNPACDRQNSSYRSTFEIRPGQWATVRLPWDAFKGYGPGCESTDFVPVLRRLGVVSIGEAKEVVLAVAKVGFYNVI